MSATVVMDQQVRNGSFDSASIPIPPGSTLLTLDTTMSSVDGLDTTKRCIVAARFSWDGATYLDFDAWRYEWAGGPDKHGNGRGPNIGPGTIPVDATGNPPARAMALIDTEGFALNMGVTLEAS